MTSFTVINCFKATFAGMGIPEILLTDNGMQYTSSEFSKFSQDYGFVHQKSSPHHHSGNSEAERAVQTIKNLLKKEQDPFIILLNYRPTPLAQGQSPAELLMNRKLKTKLPSIPDKNRMTTLEKKMQYSKNRRR